LLLGVKFDKLVADIIPILFNNALRFQLEIEEWDVNQEEAKLCHRLTVFEK
jgi:hypothetical protein